MFVVLFCFWLFLLGMCFFYFRFVCVARGEIREAPFSPGTETIEQQDKRFDRSLFVSVFVF